MEILHLIIKCLGIIIMAFSVVSIYDARKLTHKFFGTSDANPATKTFKVVGIILFWISAAVVIWG
jgi:hypothetical protein